MNPVKEDSGAFIGVCPDADEADSLPVIALRRGIASLRVPRWGGAIMLNPSISSYCI